MILDRRVHKVTIFVVKILPSIGCLVMWAHCLTLLLGKEWVFAESAFGLSAAAALLLMLLSIEYRFCIMHKLQILYIISMQFCITFQREYGFGEFLALARIVMCLLGAMLMVRLFTNFKVYLSYEPRRYKQKKPRSEAEILQDIYNSLNCNKAFERKNMMHEEQIKESIAKALHETGIINQISELRERLDDFEEDNLCVKRGYHKKNVFRIYNSNYNFD